MKIVKINVEFVVPDTVENGHNSVVRYLNNILNEDCDSVNSVTIGDLILDDFKSENILQIRKST